VSVKNYFSSEPPKEKQNDVLQQ